MQALMNSIRDIYSDLNPEAWHYRLLAVVSKLIPSDVIVYNKINMLTQKVVYYQLPAGYVSPEDTALFAEFMHEHPCIRLLYPQSLNVRGFINSNAVVRPDFIIQPEKSVLKISDFLNDAQFRRLGLYNEFFKKADVEYQISVALSSHQETIEGIALNRSGEDFSERDRTILCLFRPHIIQAFINAEAVSCMPNRVKTSADQLGWKVGDLSLRESEVLHWVSKGKNNTDIAVIMGISLSTVKKHLEHIYNKLGVENRTSAVLVASQTPWTI